MRNNPLNLEEKRAREKEIVLLMIKKYCKGKRHGEVLCSECSELMAYVAERVDRCPFMETKTYCSNCPVHCYKPSMQEKIKEVMRYAGPRMLLSHPIITLDHVYQETKHKLKLKLAKER